ncbi:MAG TPA: hypothetical protein DCR21_01440 [Succinivibrionaceae bacterium]|nr:DUF2333 family protein [Succinivibrio sp.]HAR79470.1 hypothetical protein [Succinivibrionaceae bacterium]
MDMKFVGKICGGLVGAYVLYVSAVGLISSPSGETYQAPEAESIKTDKDKAVVISEALCKSIDNQLSSFFGWLPNDLLLVPTILDNTTSYQRGVIYATRQASDVLSKTVARYGNTDTVDKRLADASARYFAYGENVWGFWFIYDCEDKYKDGIKCWKNWAQSVGETGKNSGVYNVKSDDIYQILKMCVSMTDYSLGILNNDEITHFDSDNNLYYAKGICSVVLNLVKGLVAVDSSIIERGSKENVEEALKRLEYVATFDPIYVTAGGNSVGDAMMPNHVAAMARHIDVANNRIIDMMNSMEK